MPLSPACSRLPRSTCRRSGALPPRSDWLAVRHFSKIGAIRVLAVKTVPETGNIGAKGGIFGQTLVQYIDNGLRLTPLRTWIRARVCHINHLHGLSQPSASLWGYRFYTYSQMPLSIYKRHCLSFSKNLFLCDILFLANLYAYRPDWWGGLRDHAAGNKQEGRFGSDGDFHLTVKCDRNCRLTL